MVMAGSGSNVVMHAIIITASFGSNAVVLDVHCCWEI